MSLAGPIFTAPIMEREMENGLAKKSEDKPRIIIDSGERFVMIKVYHRRKSINTRTVINPDARESSRNAFTNTLTHSIYTYLGLSLARSFARILSLSLETLGGRVTSN